MINSLHELLGRWSLHIVHIVVHVVLVGLLLLAICGRRRLLVHHRLLGTVILLGWCRIEKRLLIWVCLGCLLVSWRWDGWAAGATSHTDEYTADACKYKAKDAEDNVEYDCTHCAFSFWSTDLIDSALIRALTDRDHSHLSTFEGSHCHARIRYAVLVVVAAVSVVESIAIAWVVTSAIVRIAPTIDLLGQK